jgi:PAS domain S-box-containing protein
LGHVALDGTKVKANASKHKAMSYKRRRETEARLRESEARFRNMADSAPALIWMTDVAGRLTFANMHFDYVFGRPAREMLGDGWSRRVHPDDLEAFRSAFQAAFAARRPFRTAVRAFDKDGEIRWFRCDGVARLSDAGAFLGYTGCAVDVTDAKRAEDHLRLLVNELNHRVKNTLTTVQALAWQTLRPTETPERNYESFQARLLALSRAHDVLTRENWEGAGIDEVVARAIEVHATPDRARFRIEGPPVWLSPRIALALAMALHELATNAVKYGALSTESGHVEIAWGLSSAPDRTTLRLRWAERGGPAVAFPKREGFGRRLIERGLANDLGGSVELRFEPPGLTCEIEAPIRGASSRA